jgi:type IV pilus assembly protein PilM
MGRGTVIGLDIGTSAVRASEILVAKSPPVLLRFGQIALPPGAVRDGEVQDPGVVGDALVQLWKQAGFKSRKVVVGLSNQRVIVRQVDLPFMDPEELRSSLEFQVQEFIPIPVEEAQLDALVLDEFTNGEGDRMMKVLLVAAASDMVHTVLESLERAKLQPEIIDLVPFALMRSLFQGAWHDDAGPSRAEAIVDVGAGVTNIVVHERGVPRFVRILVMGGNDFTDALAVGLGVDPADAETVKRQAGYGPTPGADGAIRILEDRTAAFVDEIRGSLDFYSAQIDSVPVGKIVLSGGGSRLGPLGQRLATALGIPVELGHPLQFVKLDKKLGLEPAQLAEAEAFMAVPVGLAMGEVA